jgi:hypothetical protein
MDRKIAVKGSEVRVLAGEARDYISLTDIARYKRAGPDRSRHPELDEKPEYG